MIISTPKTISKVLTLRPSLPMIRPLSSSFLMLITLISLSAANSPAKREVA